MDLLQTDIDIPEWIISGDNLDYVRTIRKKVVFFYTELQSILNTISSLLKTLLVIFNWAF